MFKSLKKQFPKLKDKDLEPRAWAIANKQFKDWQKTNGESVEDSKMDDFKVEAEKTEVVIAEVVKKDNSVKRDEKGRRIIAENVPIIFNTQFYSGE